MSRWQTAADATAKIRRECLEDLRFYNGEQWPNEIKQVRELAERPCLTINRLPQFTRRVTNEQRQNRPEIKVIATDDATLETAEIIEGMIRQIQRTSDADVAYATACENQVVMGFGYIRVATDYCDAETFDQEIKIQEVKNPFSVYFDPHAVKPDFRDAEWCFVVEDITKETFSRLYPKAKMPGGSGIGMSSIGDLPNGWAVGDTVRVAEYFEVIQTPKKIYQLSDGSTVDELPEYLRTETKETLIDENLESVETQATEQALGFENLTIVNERETFERKIMWYKITGVEILEKREWLGKFIPIVPVIGSMVNVDGETTISGMVRNAKDTMRMYNYWATAQTEMIALAPKSPFIAAVGQIENLENIWRTANTTAHAVLPYNPVSIDGVVLGAPQRQAAEPPIQAMAHMMQQAGEDLKNVTGIYDASLGQKSNETSGKAILARQQQGDTANYHFIDNLSRAMKHVGTIVLDLLPYIYDTPRVVGILHADGQEELVKINEIFGKGQNKKKYDITTGKYDVAVITGPSYVTKRAAAAESMIAMTQANPAIWQIAGDIITKNMDWPGAEEIAERMKATLPPELQKDEEKEGQEIPPQIRMQMQQYDQMIQQLTAALNDANTKLETKQLDIESKERIATQNNETQIAVKLMGDNMILMKEELAHLRARSSMLGSEQPIGQTPSSMPGEAQPELQLQA